MNDQAQLWFKVVMGIFLLWNLLGVFAFLQHTGITAESVATIDEAEQQSYISLPLWVSIAFACAVFGGVAGCLAALLKRKVAVALFAVSLVGVLVQNYHTLMIGKDYAQYDASEAALPISVILVAIYLFIQSVIASKRGWLR